MNTRFGWSVIAVLTVIIIVLAVLLMAAPVPSRSPNGGTPRPSPAPQPFTSENVKVSSPLPNATLGKAFTVIGEAQGTWYFEASFPVQIRDSQNNLIAQTHAEAQSDWMTQNLVPFTATVTVENYSGPATLVLLKDNPSGLPENDDSVEFPIVIQ